MSKLASFQPKEFFFRLINPNTWFNSLEVSDLVDKMINDLIDEDRLLSVEDINNYTAAFKTKSGQIVEIWIANFPHAYGNVYRVDGHKFSFENYGPHFTTRYKLAKYIADKIYEKGMMEFNKLNNKE